MFLCVLLLLHTWLMITNVTGKSYYNFNRVFAKEQKLKCDLKSIHFLVDIFKELFLSLRKHYNEFLKSHDWFLNMLGYECFKGPSSIEYLRGTEDFELPFSKGPIRNIIQFCCYQDNCIKFSRLYDIICRSREQHVWKPLAWPSPKHLKYNAMNHSDNCWKNKLYECC